MVLLFQQHVAAIVGVRGLPKLEEIVGAGLIVVTLFAHICRVIVISAEATTTTLGYRARLDVG